MKGLSKIKHNGIEIIYLNYKALSEPEIIACLQEAEKLILKDNKPFSTLTNFNGAFATKKVMEQAGRLGHATGHLAVKGAIVGADGAKSLVLRVFNRELESEGLTAFKDEESALKFLTTK